VVLEKDGEINWTNRVRNVEVIKRVKEERRILHGMKLRYTDFIRDVLRNMCLLKRIIE